MSASHVLFLVVRVGCPGPHKTPMAVPNGCLPYPIGNQLLLTTFRCFLITINQGSFVTTFINPCPPERSTAPPHCIHPVQGLIQLWFVMLSPQMHQLWITQSSITWSMQIGESIFIINQTNCLSLWFSCSYSPSLFTHSIYEPATKTSNLLFEIMWLITWSPTDPHLITIAYLCTSPGHMSYYVLAICVSFRP